MSELDSSIGIPVIDFKHYILTMRPKGAVANKYKWSDPISGFNMGEMVKAMNTVVCLETHSNHVAFIDMQKCKRT